MPVKSKGSDWPDLVTCLTDHHGQGNTELLMAVLALWAHLLYRLVRLVPKLLKLTGGESGINYEKIDARQAKHMSNTLIIYSNHLERD